MRKTDRGNIPDRSQGKRHNGEAMGLFCLQNSLYLKRSEPMKEYAEQHIHVFDPLIFREKGYTCYRCYEKDAEAIRRNNRLKALLRTG